MAKQVGASGRPVIFYVHPREIDPEHPRLPMKFSRRFKSYVNLRGTEEKIQRILADFSCTSFREHLKSRGMPKRVLTSDFMAMPELFLNTNRPTRDLADSPAALKGRS
jgi:Domain of unknown function (DUF3473)